MRFAAKIQPFRMQNCAVAGHTEHFKSQAWRDVASIFVQALIRH
jgi:hypothetical protein